VRKNIALTASLLLNVAQLILNVALIAAMVWGAKWSGQMMSREASAEWQVVAADKERLLEELEHIELPGDEHDARLDAIKQRLEREIQAAKAFAVRHTVAGR
jgi:hypothetical protein